MSKEDGGPAFPEAGLSGLPNGEFIHGQSGMSLRDYFAAKAMAGALRGATWEDMRDGAKQLSETAYAIADAMIESRGK